MPQGQFIYTKYAFEVLEDREKGVWWSLAELDKHLPAGLEGMFKRVLSQLYEALGAERPLLLALLKDKLLPVLCAFYEPPTLEELAWATGAEAEEVRHGDE